MLNLDKNMVNYVIITKKSYLSLCLFVFNYKNIKLNCQLHKNDIE